MKSKIKRTITKMTAREIIKRELGVANPAIETIEHGKVYEYSFGACWATVSCDEDRNAIHFSVRRSGTRSMNIFFDPVTLEEDYDAQCAYEREIDQEIREG